MAGAAFTVRDARLDRSLRRPADFESVDSSVSQILCEVCGRIIYEDVASEAGHTLVWPTPALRAKTSMQRTVTRLALLGRSSNRS